MKHRKVINESLAEPDGACSSGENAGAVVDNLEIPIDLTMGSEDEQSDYVNELLKFILNMRVKQGLSEKSTEMIIKKYVDCCMEKTMAALKKVQNELSPAEMSHISIPV